MKNKIAEPCLDLLRLLTGARYSPLRFSKKTPLHVCVANGWIGFNQAYQGYGLMPKGLAALKDHDIAELEATP